MRRAAFTWIVLLLLHSPAIWASEPSEPKNLSSQMFSSNSLKSLAVTCVRDLDEEGRVRVLRETRIDAQGHSINHGRWREVDSSSRLVSEGKYADGMREGLWLKIHRDEGLALFRESPYCDFLGPFISEADFSQGKLHGAWRVYDAERKLVSELHFRHGARHGDATWFHADGSIMRKLSFEMGLPHGAMLLYGAEGEVLEQANFLMGRQLISKSEYYDSEQTQLRSCGFYLDQQIVMTSADDWEHTQLARFSKNGKQLRHGVYTEFHRNGEKALQGEYENDRRLGRFQWWGESGGLMTTGAYLNGKLNGVWKWWTAEGKLETQGEYLRGEPVGRWRWYDEQGNLIREGRMPRVPRRHTA